MNIKQKDNDRDMKTDIAKPGFCCLGIVDTCMLNCQMCDKWKGDLWTKGKDEPTNEQYKEFLKQLRSIVDEGFEINIGGGEALMRKDLLELVRYMKDLGFRVTIASNGWLIDKEMAKRIVDSGLDSLIISIDSLNPALHDEMRGVEGVHSRAMNALKYVRSYSKDIHLGLCTIIMEKTIDGIIDLANWSRKRPELINSHLFMALMQPNNTEVEQEWMEKEKGNLWPQDIDKVTRVLDELIVRRARGEWIGNSVEQLEAMRSYFKNPLCFVKKTACNLDKALHVSAIGDIFLCFRHEILGNIKEARSDIGKQWFSDEYERTRENIRKCQDNCHYLINCYFEGDYPFVVKEKEVVS